jgi:glucose-6-phosphate 1-dehydrogenase
MTMSHPAGLPSTIVIFGASGDLTQRKLVPALYNLFRKQRLPAGTRIVGFARRAYSDQDFRQRMREGIEQFSPATLHEDTWQAFAAWLSFFQGNLDVSQDYQALLAYLVTLEGGPAHRLYYLATAPNYYEPAVQALGAAGMDIQDGAWRRLVIEKPFGVDLASAQALNRVVHSAFDESQVYRIDHYLGKETAQNLLFFRFANTIFEPVWNRRYIDHVQITVAETVDVGHRAGYYDTAGVLRDMFQNHLLQLLSLVAMEPPASFEANALRNEKVKVLAAIRPLAVEQAVLAQYRGYTATPGVAPDSRTPTYAALQLFLDNWRWKGVPFYLRSGKSLAAKASEIVVVFQHPPHVMFNLPEGQEMPSNSLSICIQPDEGIHLKFETKVPDSAQDTRSVNMEFHYRSSFGDGALPDAYERLLLDALNGDAALFARGDEIEQAWKVIEPLIRAWEDPAGPALGLYEPGEWGPVQAHALLERSQRAWLVSCAEGHTDSA